MYDIDAALDQQILQVQKNRPAVIFIEATDPRIIEAACHLARFVRPVFLASEEAVRAVVAAELGHVDATRVEFALSESAFCDPEERTDLLEEFARACTELPQTLRRTADLDEAMRLLREPARFGIMAVRQGHADMVVGGIPHEPRDYFRPMIRLLAKQEVLCEAGVFVLPDSHTHGHLPPQHPGHRRRGGQRHHDPRGAGPRGGRHLRRGPRPLPRGRAADHQRRHGLLLATRARTRAPAPSWCARPPSWCRRSWPSGSPTAAATRPSASRARSRSAWPSRGAAPSCTGAARTPPSSAAPT